MYLIVGLGNPGKKYEHTRHNVGFDIVEALAKRQGIRIDKEKEGALVGECFIGGKRVMIAEPQTFMNLSGTAVAGLMNYFKIPAENLLICYDDTDLPQGNIRIRKNGSAGTHNGMRSIVEWLGYDNFPRLRVGIGQRREGYDLANWVLGHYITDEEKKTAEDAFNLAAEAIEEYISNGVESAMCKYNTKKAKKEKKPVEVAEKQGEAE